MTRFEERGIEIQKDSRSEFDCKRRMQTSCDICSTRGMQIECKRCAIREFHELMLSVYHDVYAARSIKSGEVSNFKVVC